MNQQINEALVKRIQEIKIPKDFENINLGYIPLGKGVLLKKEVSQGLRQTHGGLLVAEVSASYQHKARIVALGPLCSQYLKVGLLVTYNGMTDIETIIHDEKYVLNNEISIEGIIEDVKNVNVLFEAPSPKELKRVEKIKENVRVIKGMRKDADNKEDEYEEKVKNKRKNPITSKYK